MGCTAFNCWKPVGSDDGDEKGLGFNSYKNLILVCASIFCSKIKINVKPYSSSPSEPMGFLFANF